MTTSKSSTRTLAIAALGVVFGDIGTSPLYTMSQIFSGSSHAVPLNAFHIYGILSLMFWSLMVVVSFKYVLFIMNADNRGEGGIMALMALVLRQGGQQARILMLMGLFGAALFYGDSVLTPAISVLSAVEGLSIASPAFTQYEVPLSIIVLVSLFMVQKQGTSAVGRWFGPLMVIWFSVLGLLGAMQVMREPSVLKALNPWYALRYFLHDPKAGFFSLGATVLALTGAEALYADMGHFGRKPVQRAWFFVVLPGLFLNYFGQGSLLILEPKAIENPFYLMSPHWALFPLIGLSTIATIIASQAVISGCYSMTQQAIHLGYSPRMAVMHTSQNEIGQIYLPGVNWAQMIAVAVLIVAFGSSDRLAAAYGIAVTGTMLITTILAYFVVRQIWGWTLYASLGLVGLFASVDLAYFTSNLFKINQGGWFPLALGGCIFLLMTTWKKGRRLLNRHLEEEMVPLVQFATQSEGILPTVPGTAIYMSQHLNSTPHAMMHSVKHFKCLHDRVIVLKVEIRDEPHVPDSQRTQVTRVNDHFFRVLVTFGFMDVTDLPAAIKLCAAQGLPLDAQDVSFILGRETLLPRKGSGMSLWRERIFIAMFRNAGSAASYFHIPPNRVVELGSQIAL
ncbi:MAG: potassium transporter Kup [Pseudomonadales bacterium]|nr:potassium transporter Kup [Pseudomonadales bacterium]